MNNAKRPTLMIPWVRSIRRFIHSLFAERSAAIATAFLLLALVGIADYANRFQALVLDFLLASNHCCRMAGGPELCLFHRRPERFHP